MIDRADYGGPMTKAAEAMFARAERKAKRQDPAYRAERRRTRVNTISPIREALHGLGLTITTLRQWEDAGIVGFQRQAGQRLVDEAALARLRMVMRLRREGFSVREISWISDVLPPSVEAMQAALDARLDYQRAARDTAIARAKGAGKAA